MLSTVSLLTACGGGGAISSVPAQRTISAWAAPMANAVVSGTDPASSEQTFRFILRPTVSGDTLSVHFSNALGTAPVTIGAATIGIVTSGAAESSAVALTFGGKSTLTIAAGQSISSDTVRLKYPYGALLAVTEYLSGSWAALPQHGNSGLWTNYETAAGAGNETSDTAGTSFTQTTTETFLVDRLDVKRSDYKETVAFIGSSTTAGFGADANEYDDLVDDVANSLHAAGIDSIGLVNLAIIPDPLTPQADLEYNPSVLERFGRDVTTLPNIAIVVQNAADVDLKSACLPAQQVIAGEQQAIADAHAVGIKIYLAVVAPSTYCNGQFPNGYGSMFPAGTGQDLQRELVNTWIESTGTSTVNGVVEAAPTADRIIDISTPITDPANTGYMLPQYDFGDDSHVNAAGQAAQAAQFPASIF